MRRAMAIQLIINREWGLAKNENPNQGAFVIDELTELVEEAVLAGVRKDRRARRRAGRHGDRLPAQQDQEEHALRMLKHWRVPDHRRQHLPATRKATRCPSPLNWRARPRKKANQLKRLADFHATSPPGPVQLKRLQQAVIDNHNVFAVLMDAVRMCSLGQITGALFGSAGVPAA